MVCLKKILFILLFFIGSCALTETKQIRKISSVTECSDYLRKVLPVLARPKGIEFEGSIPTFIDYEYVANFISRKVKKLYPLSKPVIHETTNEVGTVFKVSFERDSQKYIYTIEDDVSLAFGLDDTVRGIEISSPILRSYQDIEHHLSIIEDLEKVGMRARPDEGAIHIHHDLDDDFSYEDLHFIYTSFSKMQNSFRDVLHYNDRRGYNKKDHLEYVAKRLKTLIDSGTNLDESLEVIEVVDDKGYIRTSHQYGTLEFRFFNSTTSKEEQLLFVDFINKFMKERNSPELIAHFKDNNEVSILDISQMIGAELHLNQNRLKAIKERNIYYEQLAAIQEGENPFPHLNQIAKKEITIAELTSRLHSSQNDLELSYFIQNKILKVSPSSYLQWTQFISALSTNQLSLSAILPYIPYQSFSPEQTTEIIQVILKNGHGDIFSKSFSEISKNTSEAELYKHFEKSFIPRLKEMTAEQDFSLSFLVKAITSSNLKNETIDKYIGTLKSRFRIGELSKVHLKTYKLFKSPPIHFNSLKNILNESANYNSFIHAPVYKEILRRSSLDSEYIENIFKGFYSHLDEQQQIKFLYFFIDFLKTDNLEEITSLIPFFEKSFEHLKSSEKLQDLISILSRQPNEIFKGPRRNQRLLNNVYKKLVSLPQATTKSALVQKIIRLTSLVKHLNYTPYIDIIINELKKNRTQDLTTDFIHMLAATHRMTPMSDDKINTYLSFVWDQLDEKNYYQLNSYEVKSLLEKLHELDRHVIKTIGSWTMRMAHRKISKHVRNRVEMIQNGR